MKLLRGEFIGFVPHIEPELMCMVWPIVLRNRDLPQIDRMLFQVRLAFGV